MRGLRKILFGWTSPLLCALTLAAPIALADEAAVKVLEQQCEQAREAKLKPLRDAEIAKCVSEQGKERAYCERYWSDYGNAARMPNGAVRPRMFHDLPQCLAAQEARRKLTFEGK